MEWGQDTKFLISILGMEESLLKFYSYLKHRVLKPKGLVLFHATILTQVQIISSSLIGKSEFAGSELFHGILFLDISVLMVALEFVPPLQMISKLASYR